MRSLSGIPKANMIMSRDISPQGMLVVAPPPMPRPAMAQIEVFVEILPGIPWTDGLAEELLKEHHYMEKPNQWRLEHDCIRRAVRENGRKKSAHAANGS